MDKSPALLALLAFSLVTGLGCATAPCSSVSTSEVRELSVWHGSGGPAPIVSSLVITSQGRALYESPRGKRFCVQLEQVELASLQQLIAREDLRQSAIEAQREGEGYSDYEEIEIEVGSWSAEIPLEITPPEVKELLLRIDAILQSHLGKRAPWMDSLDEIRAGPRSPT